MGERQERVSRLSNGNDQSVTLPTPPGEPLPLCECVDPTGKKGMEVFFTLAQP